MRRVINNIHLSISISTSIHPSIYLSTYLPINYVSVYLSIYLYSRQRVKNKQATSAGVSPKKRRLAEII